MNCPNCGEYCENTFLCSPCWKLFIQSHQTWSKADYEIRALVGKWVDSFGPKVATKFNLFIKKLFNNEQVRYRWCVLVTQNGTTSLLAGVQTYQQAKNYFRQYSTKHIFSYYPPIGEQWTGL